MSNADHAIQQVFLHLPDAVSPDMMSTFVRGTGRQDADYHSYHLTGASRDRLIDAFEGWIPRVRCGSFVFEHSSRPADCHAQR